MVALVMGCLLLSLEASAWPRAAVRPRLGRRELFGRALLAGAASALPERAASIVNGAVVSDEEAAAVGAVGLYIDLTGCKICRKGVPATCTGTLIAPDLVLSARHCSDVGRHTFKQTITTSTSHHESVTSRPLPAQVPASLNGSLTKVVFAADMLNSNAPYREVETIVSTADYGIDSAGNDLLLIKMKV